MRRRNSADIVDDLRRHVRRAAVGAVTIGLVTMLSGLAWAAVVSHEASDLAARTLDTRAAAVQAATQDEFGRYSDAVRLVAAGLASGGRVDAASFRTATAPLGSMAPAGATSLAFMAAPVGDAGLDRFRSTWRRRGAADLRLAPEGSSGRHIFSVYSVNLDGSSQRRTGVDVAQSAAPYRALMTSRARDTVSISDAYQLIIDQHLPESERQTSFVVTAPVMSRGRFLGWVLMGLRGQDFLGGVLGRAAEGRVDVELMATDTAGHALVVAETGGAGATEDPLRRTITIRAAHQSWTLDVRADTPALIGNIRYRSTAIRVISVVIGLLVAGLWWSVTSSRARARGEVRAATADLAVAEETARRQAVMLHTMVETIDDVGVTVVDESGAFLVQSRAARRMLGVDADPAGGAAEGIGDVDGPGRWQRHYGMYAVDGSPFPQDEMPLVRALAGESTQDIEMVIRNAARPDGLRIAVSGRPIELGQGRTGALAVFRDVTEERRRQVEQAAFAGMVAHDLKNPLAVVRGLLELVEDGVQDLIGPPHTVSAVAAHLRKSSAATVRLVELIDDLLAYSTADNTPLHTGQVELGGLVRDTLAEVIAGHRAERETAGRPPLRPLVHVGDLPTVLCDEERMRQVLGNLIGNALKYVAPGRQPVVEVTAEGRADGGARIFVADRGIGIPDGLRVDVVKPFVRTPTTSADPSNYPGTGLGLAICHRIVERHGGMLRLEPNPGGGTVVVIDLPPPVGPHDSPGSRRATTAPVATSRV